MAELHQFTSLVDDAKKKLQITEDQHFTPPKVPAENDSSEQTSPTASTEPSEEVTPVADTPSIPGSNVDGSMSIINKFSEYGEELKRDNSLRDLAVRLGAIAQHAEALIQGQTDDWFDKHTVSRNMKELKKYVQDFEKYAHEADQLHERLSSLFEDAGRVLDRYFDMGTTLSAPSPEAQSMAEGLDIDGSALSPSQRYNKFVQIWVTKSAQLVENIEVTPEIAEKVCMLFNKIEKHKIKTEVARLPTKTIITLVERLDK